ncbi:endonuclease/exonuclease/phosphatase family protein [Planctomicrobium sp. SH668]|uniref:endonuclease/exonuclease/phosphatase family protein n=1 Tax=Planctomicrobium sp. SH668 TaxID=3448126 RepID=UPI003F5B303E
MKHVIVVLLGLVVSLCPALKAEAEETIRVMTYNIHHGEGLDEKLDLSRIARIIKEAKADLILLQEVDSRAKRSHSVDQVAELAKMTGLHGQFSKAIALQGGEYGQAILSRYPIEAHQIHKLTGKPKSEQRIAAEHVVEINGRNVRVVTVHLDFSSPESTQQQAKEVLNILSESVEPVILGGDFNATPDSPALSLFKENWEGVESPKENTFPADQPRTQIDFILVLKGKGLSIQSGKVIEESVASDHRPVLTEMILQ